MARHVHEWTADTSRKRGAVCAVCGKRSTWPHLIRLLRRREQRLVIRTKRDATKKGDV
jgi:hypothetical protein